MTPESQRIAIAEACGLSCESCKLALDHFKDRDGYPDAVFQLAKIPDYLNDLNAMHEAVASLSEDQQHAYAVLLAGMLWKPQHTRGWQDYRDTLSVSEATAAQRAEAFLRALGLWKD